MKRALLVIWTALAASACYEGMGVNPEEPAAGPQLSSAPNATWIPIADLATARYGASAATGPDGRIYVFGGLNSVTRDPGAEVYDPQAQTWAPIAQPARRFLAGAATASDGRIYLAGGDDLSSLFASVVAYDPTSDTYADVAPMSDTRDAPAAATGPDGRVYVVGGMSSTPLSSGEVYDPTSNTWSAIASAPTAHYAGAGATGGDGRIYVFGGFDANFDVSTAAEAYDPGTDTWTPVASLPGPRYGHQAVTGGDGLIYIIGGSDDQRVYLSSVFAYDPVSNQWMPVAPLNTPRYLPAAAAGRDGTLYAMGGQDGSSVVNTAESYVTVATNQPPIADAGPDLVAECAPDGARVQLDGTGSSDPDDGIATFEWMVDGTVVATGATPTVSFGMGETVVTLRVTDHGGLSSTDDVLVSVRDGRPPVISLPLFTDRLWPPNHSLVRVASRIAAWDSCDPDPVLTVTVSHNEGDDPSDWRVEANGDGTFSVWVRSERDGGGGGRVYTITATAADHAGNKAWAKATVTVSH